MTETTVTFSSPIFNTNQLRETLSRIPMESARKFKDSTKRRQIESRPQGELVEKRSGAGFRRFHRASRRGQRPSPDTLTLVNATTSERTGEFSAETFIAPKVNPENKELASVYAERLQNNLDRPIMSEQDAKLAQKVQDYDVEKAVEKLI